ncbi:MAG TPA: hypothetical protein VHR86_09090, partial [Armatimonadota bacterium]|nr:hypothetical protein [Armatimonadota bacterium]
MGKIGWRRILLVGSLVLLQTIGLFGNPLSADKGKKWFRGQLHCHTYLSDGQAFPEQVAAIYKQRGYNFLAITDHNHFADDKDVWREIAPTSGKWPPKVTQGIFDSYIQQFGKDWVDVKTNGVVTSVRLKTYEEIKARFEEPGKFLLLPGVELTQLASTNIHANYINLPVNLPCIKGPDLVKRIQGETEAGKIIAMNAAEAKEAAAQLNRPYLFMLNHPFWVYWDIRPEVLLDCPEVRFFEIANGGSRYAPEP